MRDDGSALILSPKNPEEALSLLSCAVKFFETCPCPNETERLRVDSLIARIVASAQVWR